MTILVPRYLLFADLVPGDGLLSTGEFTLEGLAYSHCGKVTAFYDENKKSMAMRFTTSDGTPYYCYENDNPKLYTIVWTFADNCLQNYVCWDNGKTAKSHGYWWLTLWYKPINGKNIVKGISTRAQQVNGW